MANRVILKRLKVYALPGGELIANHREGALPPVDDGWWQDVLLDPRARFPAEATRFDNDSHTLRVRVPSDFTLSDGVHAPVIHLTHVYVKTMHLLH
jgi:hypothetical protein